MWKEAALLRAGKFLLERFIPDEKIVTTTRVAPVIWSALLTKFFTDLQSMLPRHLFDWCPCNLLIVTAKKMLPSLPWVTINVKSFLVSLPILMMHCC